MIYYEVYEEYPENHECHTLYGEQLYFEDESDAWDEFEAAKENGALYATIVRCEEYAHREIDKTLLEEFILDK